MQHGVITTVNYDDGVVTCHVQKMDRVDVELRNVPVMKSAAGDVSVPQVDEIAVMDQLDDGTHVIIGYLAKLPDGENPTVDHGERVFRFDAGTELRFSQNANGNWDIDLTASGDITIDGIDFDQHVHDYGDSTIEDTADGTGTETTTAKQTDPPV